MKFLNEGSLPADLRGARMGSTLKATLTWLDPSKLSPLPVDDGWIDVDTALTIVHEAPKFRAALKKHSQAGALDRFAAEICRQLPNSDNCGVFRLIAEDLGGHETADVLAVVMNSKTAEMVRHWAVVALRKIGDKTHLPALALFRVRVKAQDARLFEQWTFNPYMLRLKLTQGELEDWFLPDEGRPNEVAVFYTGQPARLERALVSGRRWTVDTFDRRIARQLVMAPLAAGLVWGYFDDAGLLRQPFVIDPETEYPAPPPGATVGIVHPAHLSAEELVWWRAQSKGLAAPFDQWSPPANVLSAEETASGQIPGLPGIKMPAARLLCRLEALGWQRPKTKTKLEFHTRAFDDLGLTAAIRYSGIPLTYGSEWGEQSIVECFFVRNRERLPLSRVSPIAISAVLGDLNALGKVEARKR